MECVALSAWTQFLRVLLAVETPRPIVNSINMKGTSHGEVCLDAEPNFRF